MTSFESVAQYETADLATIFEIERWMAKVGGREQPGHFELRVTTTFRREDGAWKLAHRHADAISTPSTDGPLRAK